MKKKYWGICTIGAFMIFLNVILSKPFQNQQTGWTLISLEAKADGDPEYPDSDPGDENIPHRPQPQDWFSSIIDFFD